MNYIDWQNIVNNVILHFHVITVKLNFNEKLLHSGNFPLRKVSEANFLEIFNTSLNQYCGLDVLQLGRSNC